VGLLVGCGSSHSAHRSDWQPVVAPQQEAALLAAVRTRAGKPPDYNPPRFDLVTLREDGSQLSVLVAAPQKGLERISAPAWSPDAQRVYFVGGTKEVYGKRFVYEESDVFAIDAEQGEPQRLTTSRDVQAVVPSPDGKTLAIARMEKPGTLPITMGLWLVDSTGGAARPLLDSKQGSLDVPGSWSPDGRVLAFTRCRFSLPDKNGLVANTCAVYTVSSDGSDMRKLADRSNTPSFSPDGSRIGFVSDRDENGKFQTGSDEENFASELYVMNADGSDQVRLTRSEGLNEDAPSWSPDGSRIAFAREGPASFADQVMTVNPDGTCPTVVIGDASTNDVHSASFRWPTWRPGRLKHGLAPRTCATG